VVLGFRVQVLGQGLAQLLRTKTEFERGSACRFFVEAPPWPAFVVFWSRRIDIGKGLALRSDLPSGNCG
jgi:hypothetical protein